MRMAELSRTEIASHPDEHFDEKLHGQQPNEKDLPEAQVTDSPGIVGHVRILAEQFLAFRKNVNAGEEQDD